MRKTLWSFLAASIALISGPASAIDAADAIAAPRADWARWQGRLALGAGTSTRQNWQTGPDASKMGSASLMGDLYLSDALVGSSGGFRATSGLIFGPRSALLSTGQPGIGAGRAFSIGSRSVSLGGVPYGSDSSATDNATLPYLGFGYTGLSVRSGWSFNADLGLVAQTPGSLRARGQNLDDAVRDMRLAPLLQLGATYAF